MLFRRSPAVLMVIAVGLAPLAVRAAGPVFWTVATRAQFLEGRSDGVYVSRDGVVTAGPQFASRLTSTPAQVWSLAEAADGTIWAGTGGDGRLLRLRPGQAEETVFDSDQTNVFAVAVSGNRVYAASSPDGRVYLVEGANPARVFFDPEERYIWALAVDAAGNVWVGAGNPAAVYRVSPAGNGQLVYRPPAAHAVSLARDPQGRLLVGTDTPGRLYRLEADGRPFVMLDAGASEVRAIATGVDGVVYVAAVSRGEGGASAAGAETPSASVTAATAPAAGTPSEKSSTTEEPRTRLFRVDADGTWESVWTTSDVIYDLSVVDGGAVLAATGPAGRLYRIERNGDVLLLSGVDARQITQFARRSAPDSRMPAFATANPGRILTSGSGDQSPAVYLSSVCDSESVARWGLIRWQAAGNVELHTRAGNTPTPDDSWTDWAGPYTRSAGEAIASPASRYLQFRATLTRAGSGPPPALTSVTIAYLPRNNRPTVSSVTVHPPGVVFQRPFTSDDGVIAGLDDAMADARRPPGEPEPPAPPLGKRMFQKGLQTITWKAEDADGDHLTYALRYRREGDAGWHDLRQDVVGTTYVWDTTTVADGRYVVRVEASDQPSNAAGRALAGSRESGPIPVDNTPPQITADVERTGGRLRVLVRARDAQSPIAKLEYALADGPWQLIYPVDGVADSPDEQFEIAVANEADLDRMMLRATDLLQNVASSAVVRR